MGDFPAISDVLALRPFVPATHFDTSYKFYVDLGFTTGFLGQGIAEMQLGPFTFLLQQFEAPGFAGNYMMQLLVKDLDSWWKHIDSLNLKEKYDVRAPSAPAMQPWGLIISYVVDPSGVLWHVAQQPK